MAPAQPAPPVAPIPHVPSAPYQQPPAPVSQPPVPQPTYPPYPTQPAYVTATYSSVKPEPIDHGASVATPSGPATSSTSAGPSTAPAVPANITSILSSLMKAGVLSSTSTPVGAGASGDGRESTPTNDTVKNAAQDYRRAILSVGIRLTSADIVK